MGIDRCSPERALVRLEQTGPGYERGRGRVHRALGRLCPIAGTATRGSRRDVMAWGECDVFDIAKVRLQSLPGAYDGRAAFCPSGPSFRRISREQLSAWQAGSRGVGRRTCRMGL